MARVEGIDPAWRRQLPRSAPNSRPVTTKPVVPATASVVATPAPEPVATKSVGDIKALLRTARLTQREFAELTDTPRRTVEDWSRGKSRAPGIALAWLRLFIETKASH